VSVDDRPIEAPGCFQLLRDSVARLPQVPERFSLELLDEPSGRRNVVRAVNAAGHRDSIIAGITWRLMPGSTRLVLLSNESPPQAMAFRSQAARPTVADARAGVAQNAALPRISKVDCR